MKNFLSDVQSQRGGDDPITVFLGKLTLAGLTEASSENDCMSVNGILYVLLTQGTPKGTDIRCYHYYLFYINVIENKLFIYY